MATKFEKLKVRLLPWRASFEIYCSPGTHSQSSTDKVHCSCPEDACADVCLLHIHPISIKVSYSTQATMRARKPPNATKFFKTSVQVGSKESTSRSFLYHLEQVIE